MAGVATLRAVPTWRVWWRLMRATPGLVTASLLLQLGRLAIQFAPALVIGWYLLRDRIQQLAVERGEA